MTDNILRFPQRQPPIASDSSDDPRATERALRDREQLQLLQVNQRIKDARGGQPRFSRHDCVKAGLALHQLKQEFLTERGDVEKAKAKFDKYHRFVITLENPNPRSMAEKAKTMVKKVEPYLRLARIVAEIGNADPIDCQIRVLRGTTYWQRGGNSSQADVVSGPMLGADTLTLVLVSMIQRVARDTNLDGLFTRMRKTPGQYDLASGTFRRSQMATLYRTAYQGGNEHWSEAPPLPSVPLLTRVHRRWSWPVRTTREGAFNHPSNEALAAPVNAGDGPEWTATITLCREIRLAVGPTVNADALGGLFECRPRILVESDQSCSGGVLTGVYDIEELTTNRSFAFQSGELWHRLTPMAELSEHASSTERIALLLGQEYTGDIFWAHQPLDDDENIFEHYYLSWTALDAAYVEHWLARSDDAEPVQDVLVGLDGGGDAAFPSCYPAFNVDRAVQNMSLRDQLISEIRRIESEFGTYEAAWIEDVHSRVASQIAAFESDLARPNE